MGRVRAKPSKPKSTQNKGPEVGRGWTVDVCPRKQPDGLKCGWDGRRAGRGGREVGRALKSVLHDLEQEASLAWASVPTSVKWA